MASIVTCMATALALLSLPVTNIRPEAAHQIALSDTCRVDVSSKALFIMRHLEHILVTWMPPASPPSELRAWTSNTRTCLLDMRFIAEEEDLPRAVHSGIDRVIELLDAYETFLVNRILVDYIAEVAEANRAKESKFVSIVSAVSAGAGAGGGVCAIAGSIACPGLGTVSGGAVGSVAGAAAGLVAWFADQRSTIGHITAQSAAHKATIQLIDQMENRYTATVQHVKDTVVSTLSSEFDWGPEAGFDGSHLKSLDEQSRLRPRDPFVYVAMAIEVGRSNPLRAAELFGYAANLVPVGGPDTNHYFDNYRATFTACASRASEYACRETANDSQLCAQRAIDYYLLALSYCDGNHSSLPPDTTVAYARALIHVGRNEEALAAIMAIDSAYLNDAFWLHETARIVASCGRSMEAMSRMRRSFELLPRIDYYSASHPAFTSLEPQQQQELKRICAPPLVGEWTTAYGRILEFYADGGVRQVNEGNEVWGQYRADGEARLELVRNGKAALYGFKISGNALVLQPLLYDGATDNYKRTSVSISGTWNTPKGTFILHENGTWSARSGNRTFHGEYAIPSLSRKMASRSILYIEDDPIAGRVLVEATH